METPNAPQSLSAERREEVAKLWLLAGGRAWREAGRPDDKLKIEPAVYDLVAVLDAVYAERTRTEIEKASGHSENAKLFREAVVRSCDETLGRQKHEIRALTEQLANARAEVEKMREACASYLAHYADDGESAWVHQAVADIRAIPNRT